MITNSYTCLCLFIKYYTSIYLMHVILIGWQFFCFVLFLQCISVGNIYIYVPINNAYAAVVITLPVCCSTLVICEAFIHVDFVCLFVCYACELWHPCFPLNGITFSFNEIFSLKEIKKYLTDSVTGWQFCHGLGCVTTQLHIQQYQGYIQIQMLLCAA